MSRTKIPMDGIVVAHETRLLVSRDAELLRRVGTHHPMCFVLRAAGCRDGQHEAVTVDVALDMSRLADLILLVLDLDRALAAKAGVLTEAMGRIEADATAAAP